MGERAGLSVSGCWLPLTVAASADGDESVIRILSRQARSYHAILEYGLILCRAHTGDIATNPMFLDGGGHHGGTFAIDGDNA